MSLGTLLGKIKNFRLTKGRAKYGPAFPTPLPAPWVVTYEAIHDLDLHPLAYGVCRVLYLKGKTP